MNPILFDLFKGGLIVYLSISMILIACESLSIYGAIMLIVLSGFILLMKKGGIKAARRKKIEEKEE